MNLTLLSSRGSMCQHEYRLWSTKSSKNLSVSSLYSLECVMNLTMDFTQILEQMIGNFTYSTLENCFPQHLSVQLEFPNQEYNDKSSITNFTTAVLIAGMFFIYEMINQTKTATDHNLVSERLSLYTIAINTVWNFCYFNLFLRYALQYDSFHSLSLAAFMYFVITFVFELRLLLTVWK